MVDIEGGESFMPTKENATISTDCRIVAINITLLEKDAYTAVSALYASELTESSTFGQGVLRYEGSCNEDGSLFLGFNGALRTYTLRFKNTTGIELFKRFRDNVLRSSTHTQLLASIKLSSLIASYTCLPPTCVENVTQFMGVSRETVSAQVRSTPKLSIEKSKLLIGGKSSSNMFELSCEVTASNAVRYLTAVYKVKDAATVKLWGAYLANPKVSLKDAVVFSCLELLGRVSMTVLLEHIRSDMLKNYQLGNIYAHTAASQVSKTRTGSTVSRSLTGVRNKLLDKATSSEVQVLLQEWLQELVSLKGSIENGEDFIQKLSEVCLNNTAPVSAPITRNRRIIRKVSPTVVAASEAEDV